MLMIKSYLINNVKNEYIPDNALFNEWLSSIEHSEDVEITIKIVTPNEMKNLNILYRDKDKISDTLAFSFDNLLIDKKIICAIDLPFTHIAICKENKDNRLHNYLVKIKELENYFEQVFLSKGGKIIRSKLAQKKIK